jgi:hypothetical protein
MLQSWGRYDSHRKGTEGPLFSRRIGLNVPFTSLGGFELDQSQEPNVIRVDYEGVTGTFDPEELLSLLQDLPDKAGSIVVGEAIRIYRR